MERLRRFEGPTIIGAPSREFEPRKHQLFLAGGISNCPDWQKNLIELLPGLPNVNIFNPRRVEFPKDDPNALKEQIEWEYDFLRNASSIAVWFSRGSLNPIVWYELGMWVNSRPKLPAFIGVDPAYERPQDVIIQTGLPRPEIEIVSSLEDLATQIRTHVSKPN
ncbi:MAG: nucleoside 2-deoxyribosyltransferase domain-containing protein [Patescibacteria group bacterium]